MGGSGHSRVTSLVYLSVYLSWKGVLPLLLPTEWMSLFQQILSKRFLKNFEEEHYSKSCAIIANTLYIIDAVGET